MVEVVWMRERRVAVGGFGVGRTLSFMGYGGRRREGGWYGLGGDENLWRGAPEEYFRRYLGTFK